MKTNFYLLICILTISTRGFSASAPASIEGQIVTSLIESVETVTTFGTGGNALKTKDGVTTPFTYSNYSTNGNIASFDIVDGGISGTVTLTFTTTNLGTIQQAISGLGTRSGTFSIRAGLAPSMLVDHVITSLINGQTAAVSFQPGGVGTKTKDGVTTPITWTSYERFGDVGTVMVTDSGITGTVTLTYLTLNSGTVLQSFQGSEVSGTFSDAPNPAPTLVSSSLSRGVVSFTFSTAMDTNWRSFSWNSSQGLPGGTFSNYRWSPDAHTLSFDANLPEGLTITFILNPTGGGGDFRNSNGDLLAANTPTQQFTVVSTTNRVFSLDGNGDYVTIPSSAAIQPTQEFTIEVWLFPMHSGLSNAHFINKGDGVSGGSSRTYELIYTPDDSLHFQVFLGTSTFVVPAVRSVPAGRWIHFAGVFSSADGQVRLYTNGVLAASGGGSIQGLPLRTTSLPLVLGYLPSFNNTYGQGSMDELRIWNVARSPEEIQSSMRSRLTGQEPHLVGYWNFDDGGITDLTTGGLNGTRVGNASVSTLDGNDTPHAPRLVRVMPEGGMTRSLTFESETNLTHRIEYSGNLTNWTTLTTVLTTNSPMTVTDTNAPATHRFYRILKP